MNHRAMRAGAAALACAMTAWGCNEQQLAPGISRDLVPPSVEIVKTAGDTMDVKQGLAFSVFAQDNLALKSVVIELTGGFNKTLTAVFDKVATSATIPVSERFPTNTTIGGVVVITVTATDGANNAAAPAVDSVFLKNDQALTVRLLAPQANAATSAGRSIPVEVMAKQRQGVRKIGWITSGAFASPIGDSLTFTSGFRDSLVFVDTLALPATPTTGSFQITAFAVDSTLRRASATPVTVQIQSTANDQTAPTVTFKIDPRVEVDDTISVTATDPSGIERLGWLATDLSGNTVGGDSATGLNTNVTSVTRRWGLNFRLTTLPQTVVITAFAVDGAGNRGTSRSSPSPASNPPARAAQQADTVLVVHGVTRPLPRGGRAADAVFNPNRNEIYFTNIERDRLEILQLSDTSFVPAGIPVGSRPWGIALWPRDRAGNTADTVVVANSGGTNLSVVDVALRRERRRHALPIFRVQSAASEIDPQTGLVTFSFKEYNLSDRPQYVGVVCRSGGGTACAPNGILAVYSTTGTAAQSEPFPLRGTIRWENLTPPAGTTEEHFIWEHAADLLSAAADKDTLQIIVRRRELESPTNPEGEVTLVHFLCGRLFTVPELGFVDTTFVRNSGDFTHALFGEGGSADTPALGFSRAIAYNVDAGVQNQCPTTDPATGLPYPELRDMGVSSAINVRDFIANTAIPVTSVALNFNGLTNLIRADSIYVLDERLRLQGVIGTSGANPGMDLNFNHSFDARNPGTPTFGGTLSPNDRLIFAAADNPVIDVFDTYFYGRVTSIPIKNPVIGPLRVARRASGEQILIGTTIEGVVVVTLPAITNIFQAPRLWGGER